MTPTSLFRSILLLSGILLFSSLEANCVQAKKIPSNNALLFTSITNTSMKFLNELDKSKNVIVSPLSAAFVLALLSFGATEPAYSEILTSLNLPDDGSLRSSFSEVTNALKAFKTVTLNVANKLYIQDGPNTLQPQFMADAVNVFDANVEKVNFANSAATAQAINEWVQNKTNDKIKDLISEDGVDESTSLVLVNAVYFKGTWKVQFDPKKTRPHVFHVNANSEIKIPMMYHEEHYPFRYSRELGADLLELPYEGNDDTSMMIILPHQIEGLNDVIAKLAAGYDLMSEINKMHNSELDVLIPKFQIDTKIDLKEFLPKLGIRAIFDSNNSGLTKILNSETPLYVSKAVQKAFIEVNEEGAEAAVATQFEMWPTSLARPFYVNRPFLYMIVYGHGDQRVPLFVGTYRGVV